MWINSQFVKPWVWGGVFAMVWMYLPKLMCWKLNPQCKCRGKIFMRWWGHEGSTFMNRLTLSWEFYLGNGFVIKMSSVPYCPLMLSALLPSTMGCYSKGGPHQVSALGSWISQPPEL
jgi:hypothetical protein